MQIRTAGDLRGFLADVLVGVQDGSIDPNKASAICKVAAQINQSLSVEVTASLQMQKAGGAAPVAGSMVIGRASDPEPVALSTPDPEPEPTKVAPIVSAKPIAFTPPPKKDSDRIWCEQCDQMVTVGQAVSCKSRHCTAKVAA